MRDRTQFGSRAIEQERHVAELDLVVPFTTPELTRAALDAAGRMGAGLNARVRLVKVQVVPFPLDLDQSPVYIDFLKDQLEGFRSDLPAAREIRLARDFNDGLLGTLGGGSVVVLAIPKRPWTTRNERLAAALRRSGRQVVLVTQAPAQTKQPEVQHA